MSSDTVPRWPRIDAIVRDDGSGEVTIDGTYHPIATSSLEEARVEVLRRVTENAAQIGRPVRASATGPEGLWNLIVHPDGTVVPEEDFDPPAEPTPQAPVVESDQEDTVRRVPREVGAPDATEMPGVAGIPGATGVPGAAAVPGVPGVAEPLPGGAPSGGFGQASGDLAEPASVTPAHAGQPSSFAAPTDAVPTDAAPTDAAPTDAMRPDGGYLDGAHSDGGLADTTFPDETRPAAGTDAGSGGAAPESVAAPGPSYAAPDYASTIGQGTSGHGTSGQGTAEHVTAEHVTNEHVTNRHVPGDHGTNGSGANGQNLYGQGLSGQGVPGQGVHGEGVNGPAGAGVDESFGGAGAAGRVGDSSVDDTRIRPAGGARAAARPDAQPAAGPVDAVPTAGGVSAPTSGAVPAQDGDAPRSRREARQSFLTHQQDEDPATRGFRGVLTKMGIRVGPNEYERAERADERAVSQHWPGPRTISMVNGKGGAGKTPSTVLLAAVFAQFGGAGVVTWDNNQTRGTLGWRTEQGPHESTLLDLLPQTDRLLGPSAQAADLARYVHHQTRDRFDVLRSKPIAMANEQRIEPGDVDAIHSVLSKYYRMILIDSGNDESDPMWQRMIDRTDQLVVATTTRDDHAEAGALLLEALATRDGRSAYLAQQAVVVVSQADQKESAGELEKVADAYRSLAREVVTIPFDPAMVDGHLRYGALRPETRRAWLAAGAAVAGGL